jgi:hypothetical protein
VVDVGADDQLISGRISVGDPNRSGQALDVDGPTVRIYRDGVVAGRPATATRPMVPARSTFTRVRSVPVASFTEIVSDPPRALTSIRLDVVEVHHDAAEIAGEQHPDPRWPWLP